MPSWSSSSGSENRMSKPSSATCWRCNNSVPSLAMTLRRQGQRPNCRRLASSTSTITMRSSRTLLASNTRKRWSYMRCSTRVMSSYSVKPNTAGNMTTNGMNTTAARNTAAPPSAEQLPCAARRIVCGALVAQCHSCCIWIKKVGIVAESPAQRTFWQKNAQRSKCRRQPESLKQIRDELA